MILIFAFFLLAVANALPSELPPLQGGYPPSKNVHLAPMKNGVVGAISFGEKGDRDRGEIRLEIPARDLKNIDFFYAGYPNGTTLRYEVRALGRKPIVLNLMPASESWLELPLRVPEGWSMDDDLSIVAIDENEQFTGWVGLAVAPHSGVFAKVFNEWRQVFAILWVLLIGFVICGPVFLCRGAPMVRCALVMLCVGIWCMVAFYLALLLPGAWHRIVLPLASALGLGAWIFLAIRRSKQVPAGVRFCFPTLMLGAVAMCCYLLPVIVAGPNLRADDPFPAAQHFYRGMPMDNRIPWILAEASMADIYKSPLFGDWLGSDRPPLQSGLIVLIQPVLGWLPPAAGAFATSCAAQGLWILGAMVLLWGLGMSGSALKCGLVTATISGFVLLNGIFTWPKLMSAGFLLASVGILLQHLADSEKRPLKAWASLILAGLLAGFSMQCHGSAAFAILPMGVFLLFRKAWQFAGPVLILRNGLAFGACFILLQVPWTLWQKLGDPPGDRLIKWHIGGVMPVDERRAGPTIIESYKNLNWDAFWKNKKQNFETLFVPPNLSASPWFDLQNRNRAMNSDFFGVSPAMSWALPAWLGLIFLGIHDREVRRRLRRLFLKFLPILLWVVATAAVWIFLMFIPRSTVNHQGPMNLALIGLLFSGAALGAVSPKVWGIATILQALGVLWLYFGLRYHPSTEVAWFWTMIACVVTMILGSIFPKNLHPEKDNL
jgi:hypothetical protein